MIAPAAVASVCASLIAAHFDARTGRIPDRVTRPASAIALAAAAATGLVSAAILGAVTVGGSLLLLYAITRGRGLGLGDVKLAAVIGIGFGPAVGLAALGVAFVAGGIYASWLLATKRADRRDPLPFGPFLAAGTVVAALIVSGSPA